MSISLHDVLGGHRETNSEFYQISMKEFFTKIFNGQKSLIISQKKIHHRLLIASCIWITLLE